MALISVAPERILTRPKTFGRRDRAAVSKRKFPLRNLFALATAATLLASTAFADVAATAPNDIARICESARLSDLERRECRAMFKNAADQTAREAVLRTFLERINGPVAGPVADPDSVVAGN